MNRNEYSIVFHLSPIHKTRSISHYQRKVNPFQLSHSLRYSISHRSIDEQSHFIEPSTNIEFIYLNDYNDYRLYKLIYLYNSTVYQLMTVNKLLEKYLQISFETPNRSYSNMLQLCGMNIFAFFARHTSPSMENLHGLLLARIEAYDNSKYICFLSVLEEHRQKGLGTKLLNQFIIDAIEEKRSHISLHVNTENNNALSLYLRCGMRCFGWIRNFYLNDETYATQNAFVMILQLKNVRDRSLVCQNTSAVEIPEEEEILSKEKCTNKEQIL